MTWLRTAALALAGILLAIGFSMFGRDGRRRRKAEQRNEQLLADGSNKALEKAVKESDKADKFKARATQSAAAGQAALDKIGAKDEDIADMVSAWNSSRLPE